MKFSYRKALRYLTVFYILISCIVLVTYPKDQIIRSDAEGYYMYLPSIFIYDGYEKESEYSKRGYKRNPTTGKFNTRYTYGVAVMQLPFFVTGHLLLDSAQSIDGFSSYFPADGYSHPYHLLVMLASIFYSLVGLMYIKKNLEVFFNERVVFFTLISVFAGTNAVYYTYFDPGYSHIYSFCLISMVLYYAPKFYLSRNWSNFLILAGLVTLIVLIRPSNIVIVVFLFFFQVKNKSQFLDRLLHVKENYGKMTFGVLLFGILVFFQLLFWKQMRNEWIFYSYESYQTFVNWYKPPILRVLFDVQNGLFIYSPIILLSFVGITLDWKKNQFDSKIITISFLLITYIFASYYMWWFGGSYGHRCYVEWYPVMAIPMALAIDKMLMYHVKIVRIFFQLLIFLMIYYSLALTFSYRHPWEGPDWTWDAFGKVLMRIFGLG